MLLVPSIPTKPASCALLNFKNEAFLGPKKTRRCRRYYRKPCTLRIEIKREGREFGISQSEKQITLACNFCFPSFGKIKSIALICAEESRKLRCMGTYR